MADSESARLRRRRRQRRLTRAQRRVAAVIAGAVLIGVAALVLALRPVPTPPPYTPSAPPLALQSGSLASQSAPPGLVESAPVRIQVAAGGIDLRVVEGDGVHVPINLAAHYPGTSQPGLAGNAVYYGHAQPGMFQGLYRLHLGDEVRLLWADGTQRVFHVAAFKKVAFNDRSVLLPTPFGELTLLTCTSYDPYTPRFIVIAT